MVRLIFPNWVLGRCWLLSRLCEGKPKRRTPRRLFGGKGALHDAFSEERRRGRRLLFFCFVENAGAAFALLGKELRGWGGRCGSPGEAVGGRRSDAADLPAWPCLLGSRGISRAPVRPAPVSVGLLTSPARLYPAPWPPAAGGAWLSGELQRISISWRLGGLGLFRCKPRPA